MRRHSLVFLMLVAGAAQAAEVGRFAFVQNQVETFKAGATGSIAAVSGAQIEIGEKEVTGASSGAKLLFGAGGLISLGQNTSFIVSPQTVDQATGASVSTFQMLAGKARVFLSRFWSGRPEVKVESQTAIVGIKGSEIGFEAFRDGRLTVTVFGGSAAVDTKSNPSQHFDLTAGEELKIDAQGNAVGRTRKVSAGELEQLRHETEPVPLLALGLPGDLPGIAPPSQKELSADAHKLGSPRAHGQVVTAHSAAAQGDTWIDPATGLLAPVVDTGCNCGKP